MGNPQLVVTDLGGVNNADLAATSARLTRGASWKHNRIIMILPTADMVSAKCALSWMNLAFPPNNGVVRILALGQEVGEAYSNAISQVLADPNLSQWEFILTVESDNAPPPDGVLRLVELMNDHPEFACLGGTYFTKGPGGVCQRWGDVADAVVNFRPQPPPLPGELGECCGTGMGFNLFRLSMFKDSRLRRPWFVTQKVNGVATQDLYFWSDARKYGYRCAISGDVRVGHHDLRGDFGCGEDMMF